MEVYNRVIKSSLHCMMDIEPGAYWDDLLPDLHLGLRSVCVSSHGYMPFEQVFKQLAHLLGAVHHTLLEAVFADEPLGPPPYVVLGVVAERLRIWLATVAPS